MCFDTIIEDLASLAHSHCFEIKLRAIEPECASAFSIISRTATGAFSVLQEHRSRYFVTGETPYVSSYVPAWVCGSISVIFRNAP